MAHNYIFYRPLGGPKLAVNTLIPLSNGLHIPQLGFGTYRLPPDEAEGAVEYALECGFRHVDCAKAYCNQKSVGKALQKALKTRRVLRENLYVTSKLWPTDQRPDVVEAACRETLGELQLDYLDLYLIHWPVCWRHSPSFETDADKYPRDAQGLPLVEEGVGLADTWRAMSALVDKGLVRAIGLSNCQEAHIKAIPKEEGMQPPVVNQVEFHPSWYDGEIVRVNREHQIQTAAYCPLAMPTRWTPPDYTPLVEDEVLLRISERTGFSSARVLLNWNIDKSNVVIVKASKKEHIKSNAKASGFALDDATHTILDVFYNKHKRCRVMNPTNFTRSGKPFFSD
ncbi:aldehyde reductase [Strigomonas culicis]|uniref:Aldehyde reductase n=1 Tax=Strigomonas culicis TaxID=28005 RepID=S9VWH4_9TRYP|nr:aldehyde reductase [Strigomonas culicis]EPY28473.1 aldehyde reductase [Strigomonas culicis]EPY33053.1 aldehyde reductase [Strigomonas culicis]EPY33769.1 aldehyde reductase [Strigomonas culicis]|eukprot:EPY27900.1 aldehyde reductase [Strigomonas culicis]